MNKILILLFFLFSHTSFAVDPVTAVATGTATKSATGVVAEKTVSKGLLGSVGEFFDTPPGILTMAGMATVYSGMLYSAAAEQEKESIANQAKLDKIIASFKDSYVYTCPAGRDKLTDPKCYCYNQDGKQNPDRTKSQTCIDLWAKDNYKITASAGDYASITQAADPVGCININGQFDVKCTCTKFVDAKGGNACMKSTTINLPSSIGPSFAQSSGLTDIMKLGANIGSGNPGFDLMTTGQLNKNAITAKAFKDKILSTYAPNGDPRIQDINAKNVGLLAKGIFGQNAINNAVAAAKSPLSSASSGSTNPKTNAALQQAATKAGFDFSGNGHGLQNKRAEAKENVFSFVGDQTNTTNQVQNFPETEKNYNYKNSDISKKDDSSIFEIISNRYIQSGLKRLFEN
ncbi:MAG: hypothetical protein Q7U04_06685 [Bacteriovorax sp.]|nr:hypothetical protein [Bacteriovorax sp.]